MRKSLYKKSCLVLLLLFFTLGLSGCWQSKEVESLEILTGAAIDLAKPEDVAEKNKTAQEEANKNAASGAQSSQDQNSQSNPDSDQNKQSGTSQQKPAGTAPEGEKQAQDIQVIPETESEKYLLTIETSNIEAKDGGPIQSKNAAAFGNSVFLASRNISQFTNNSLYWSHTNVFVLGESFAKDGVYSLIDTIIRTTDIRLNINLVVAKGADGADVLKCPNPEKQAPSFHLMGLFKNTYKYDLEYELKAYRFINELGDNQGVATLPAVSLQANPDTGEPVQTLDGLAIFKDAKLLGFLPDQESQYYYMAINFYKKGYPFSLEKDGQTILDLDLKSGKTKFSYKIKEDGSVSFQLKMNVQFLIGDSNMQDNAFSADRVKEFETMAAEKLKRQTESCIRYVQQNFGVDIFNFGTTIKARNTQKWFELEEHWSQLFTSAQVEVIPDVTIRASGFLKEPVEIGKEQTAAEKEQEQGLKQEKMKEQEESIKDEVKKKDEQ